MNLKISLILTVFIFSNCSFARDLSEILKDKKIKIAVDTTYPPMEFESDNGKVIGFDIDLAREVAKQLKLEAEFIVMPWDGILAGLIGNRYDIIMSSMNITPDREKTVNFVPYFNMGQIFIIKVGASKIQVPNDLRDKVIAVQADTTSYEALEKFKKSGIAIKEIKSFKGGADTFTALKSNQAQGIIIDEAVGLYYTSLDPKNFMISGNAMKAEPIGIAIRKSDQELFKAIKLAVNNIKKNGIYNKIYKNWFKVDPK
jgi:ABC-type amino acid transport substrate-binding protein